jgi:tRNA(fMet)-specific endonuclease VapC
VILDTDALVALLKGEPAADEAIRRLEEKDDQVATTIISAYELLRGAYVSSEPERNLAEVHEVLSNTEILDLTLQACEEASKIYRDLRKKGCLIGENDVLIAGIAKTHAEVVMTRDAHFKLILAITAVEW